MAFLDFMIPVLVALISGLLIGLEREFKNKNAGLKTNALVSVGAAIFMLISLKFEHQFGVDITRVLSQVVVGIGFLGAGVIVRKGANIHGLTTAATVWCCAALGCLAAVEMYLEVAAVTILIIAVNFIFGFFDHKIGKE
ncbi:MgtC/SapB family protein [Mesonia aquimarina]|uniref:MgtC/SapB family protein n=1 Tax=Mesonia aquimarina TaxID=1504967 RepID=UPI000EF5CED4|nr:MgtC/SapB family protein [Mesonia aquimarina]